MQPNGTGIPVQLDPKFLSWFEPKPSGVGMPNQEVAVAVNSGAEISLTATGFPCCAASAGWAGKLPSLGLSFGLHQGSVEAFFEKPSAGSDITTTTGDVVLWPVAQGSRLVKQFFADEHLRH
tara:strand:+ start:621 stop:986 length:366 start_codon:yes stop_codon:yes gene_type:complete